MYKKILKKLWLSLIIMLFVIPFNVFAYSDYIIAGGQNVGIKLNSKGVLIVGLYEINGTSPGNDAGLRTGDTITKINNETINNIPQMVEVINRIKPSEITINYSRNNSEQKTTLKIIKENDIYKTGLYVKDSITGVGTLTFIDPNTKIFGALGHEIIEKSTGKILEIKNGTIFKSTVTGIERSETGNPGEKNARYFSDNINGSISQNTSSGIFGNYTTAYEQNKLYKVANPDEIKTGPAKIYTVIDGENVEEFNINILRINDNNQLTKNLVIEITDESLLKKTGGIIQGMSGSPIIQGNNIIGAVTHVVVDKPNRGYGIFITNMLKTAEGN